MGFYRSLVRNSVLTNVVVLIVVVMGVLAFRRMPRQVYSHIDFNWIFVMAVYPGASPEEIEASVVRKIEKAVSGIEKIQSVTSLASEGEGQVSIRFESMPEADFNRLYQDLRREIDAIREDLPDGVRDIVYFDLDTASFEPVVFVSLQGDHPEAQMRDWAEELSDRIEGTPGVSKMNFIGIRDRRIYVDVDPASLRSAGLPLSAVVGALRSSNLNLPAGNLSIGEEEFLVTTIGQAASVDELGEVILRSSPGGGQLRVSDVAAVRSSLDREGTRSTLNGLPAYTLMVIRRPDMGAIEVVRNVRATVDEFRSVLPDDVNVVYSADSTRNIRDILGTLSRNAGFGIVLVVLILLLFLETRNALFAAVGIAVSFCGTFLILDLIGETLNATSLFGLVLVLGMVVDDAIVILENIYRHLQSGLSTLDAATKGTREVAFPVLSSSLTTVAGFLPLMLLPGIMGDFMKVVPITVSIALAVSLFEALFVLPTHVADWGRSPSSRAPIGSRLLDKVRPRYLEALDFTVRHRYAFIGVAIVLPLLAMGVVAYKVQDADLFAGEESGYLHFQVRAPAGSTIDRTMEIVKNVEAEVLAGIPEHERTAVITTAGLMRTEIDWYWKPSVGEVFVELAAADERDRSMDEIASALRSKMKAITGPTSVTIWQKKEGPATGKAVEFKIKGPNMEKLTEVADRFSGELSRLPGVVNVEHDLRPGKKQIRIHPKPAEAARVGVSNLQIAAFVRSALDGEVATQFHDDDEEVDVVVRVAPGANEDLSGILSLHLPTSTGALVPLGSVAAVEMVEGYAEIPRFDRERAVTISADVTDGGMSAGEVSRWVESRFAELGVAYPECDLDFEGELKEFEQALGGIGRLGLFGLLLIYLILGAQFRSFIQPILILYTIPIGIAGAAVSLLVSGAPLTITTLYGFVALAGVVVNDSLVLVEFINAARARGGGLHDAIIEAGSRRLRPIVLTTLTTIFGLLPMMLGIGGVSPVWGPLASTIVWGLTVATLLTLFLIPALYGVLDDLSRILGVGRFHGAARNAPRGAA